LYYGSSEASNRILLAANDLQGRIWNITENALLTFLQDSLEYQDGLIIYTAFVFGQYLCWTHILRQQAQFACFATEERDRTKRLVDLFNRIQNCLNKENDKDGSFGGYFKLWKGHQLAIGELMTVSSPAPTGNTELLCMGYAEFTRKWKEGKKAVSEHKTGSDNGNGNDEKSKGQVTGHDSEIFRGWFKNIESGIYRAHKQEQRGDSTGLNRIRRLQHLLLELIEALDPDGARARDSSPVSAAPNCPCTRCQADVPKTRTGNV
jgi:hypothetical protein